VLYSAELGTQDLSMLEISAHSPVHLLLVDPQGRQTGYDPRSGEYWDEIPMGGYLVDTITAPSGLSLPESKLVLISKPTQGRYLLRAIGYEAGDYRIDVQQTFPDGSTQVTSFTGSAENGSLDAWSFDFSQEKKVYFPTTRKQ
jgi:hypothetical protein